MFLRLNRSPAAAFICCIAVLFVAVSCSDDPVTPAPEPESVPADLEITVDTTFEPTFTISWNPKLRVNKLYVEGFYPDYGPSYLVWFIADENGLTPPITYGDLPTGAQALRPARSAQDMSPHRVTIIRSDGYADEILATSHRSAGAVAQGPVVYMPELMKLTPPGVTPEVWEFTTRVATVSSTGWGADGGLETTLDVRGTTIRELVRDEQGVQRLIEYENYRMASEPGGDPDFGFIWDFVPPAP